MYTRRAMKLIAGMISYNNSHEIWHCLNSLKQMDAIYIVDGGSSDNTVDLMRAWAKRNSYDNLYVTICEWQDDFARQRNNCLNFIEQELRWSYDNTWVLSIDCDDVLCSFDRQGVAGAIQPHHKRIAMNMQYSRGTLYANPGLANFDGIRMFRLSPYNTWMNAVHEYIDVDSSSHDGDDRGDTNNILTLPPQLGYQHVGHATQHLSDPLRNIRIGYKLVAECPDNIRARYYLARDLIATSVMDEQDRYRQAVVQMRRYYELVTAAKASDASVNTDRNAPMDALIAKALNKLYGPHVNTLAELDAIKD